MYVHLSHVGRSSCDECWDEGVGTGLDWLACPVLSWLAWVGFPVWEYSCKSGHGMESSITSSKHTKLSSLLDPAIPLS